MVVRAPRGLRRDRRRGAGRGAIPRHPLRQVGPPRDGRAPRREQPRRGAHRGQARPAGPRHVRAHIPLSPAQLRVRDPARRRSRGPPRAAGRPRPRGPALRALLAPHVLGRRAARARIRGASRPGGDVPGAGHVAYTRQSFVLAVAALSLGSHRARSRATSARRCSRSCVRTTSAPRTPRGSAGSGCSSCTRSATRSRPSSRSPASSCPPSFGGAFVVEEVFACPGWATRRCARWRRTTRRG